MTKEIVRLEKISKHFGRVRALNQISFRLEEGEIFGYVGPNGAGKTTTIRIMCGLLRPDGGRVRLFGAEPYSDEHRSFRARQKIGVVLEEPGHFVHLSAYKNLKYYADVHRLHNAEERIINCLKTVGLLDRKADLVETFSKGMKQRLAIARCILHDPDFLILDEPTTGLDPTAQIEIREMMSNLSSTGKTIFYSSHRLDEVEKLCTRIGVINNGNLVFLGKTKEFKKKYRSVEDLYSSVVRK